MNICIVTGSSGLIGSETVRFFSAKGFKVIGIDNNFRAHFFGKNGDTSWVKNQLKEKLKNFNHYNCDVRDKKKSQIYSKSFLMM